MVTHPNKHQCLGVSDLVFPLPDFDDGKLYRASTSTRQPFHLEKEIKIKWRYFNICISLQRQAASYFKVVASFTIIRLLRIKIWSCTNCDNKRTEGPEKTWRGQSALTLNKFSKHKKWKKKELFSKSGGTSLLPKLLRASYNVIYMGHDRSTF